MNNKLPFNKLLLRQIRRTIGNDKPISPEMEKLLVLVSDSYEQYEKDRALVERSIEISSEEMRAINASLIEQKTELEQNNEELQNLNYVIVHDLKEPLRSIASYTQIIKKRLIKKNLLTDDIAEFMQYAVSGTKRMHELLTDLMDYSTINKKDAHSAKIDLNNLVEIVKSNLKIKIDAQKGTFTIEDLPIVKGNKAHLISLFQNLIENSLKFQKANNLKIAITSKIIGDFAEITVADNGIGLPEGNKVKLFNIFKRAHSQSEFEGTGIGLSICRKIVQNHNGNIWIDENYINGFKICFTLPIYKISGNLI